MNYKEVYNQWLQNEYFDEATRKELKNIEHNEKEIEDRFFKNLEFGTGGIRGVIGAGINRINIYTVRKATQGLANYILKQEGSVKAMGVVIAHDSRSMSPEFTEAAALVLNANGIKTYVFESLRPTPELSYAVRKLGCIAGIMITASHNPKEYNGYKAYWQDGGQIPYPRDEAIIQEVNAISDFSQIQTLTKEEAIQKGLFQLLSRSLDDSYIEQVKQQSINPDMVQKMGSKMTIVYTPLHGAGYVPVCRVLKEIGFTHVEVVQEQANPDPQFPTVVYPNPEDPKAFTLAMELAKKISADLILGTDPDSDRMGAIVKNSSGKYEILSGNMIGVLICEYILSQKKASGVLPANGVVISTIVSTDMTKKIVESYGIAYMEVLTGFKYIGEKIKEFEKYGRYEYLFGFEESYGSLAGTYARDKDAVSAAMLIAELAAEYKSRGLSLYEGLQELYQKYGYFRESARSISLAGVAGLENIKKIMSAFRQAPPHEINGIKIVEIRDYQQSLSKNLQTGEEKILTLPHSDVLYFILEDDSWFCIRPSGTEPKVKVYFGVKGSSHEDTLKKEQTLLKSVMESVQNQYEPSEKSQRLFP